jgi:hypothetical protein
MKKTVVLLIVCLIAIMLLAGCMPNEDINKPDKTAGFLMGIWHGWIAPISLIAGIFDSGIRVYEPNNTGWWYDFGFYIAIISGFGGLSLFRKKSYRNNNK